MALASLIVAIIAVLLAGVSVFFSKNQTRAAIDTARAAKTQADAAKVQAEAAMVQIRGALTQEQLAERQQAEKVRPTRRQISGREAGVLPGESGENVHMIVVMNDSDRPIRYVAARITPVGQPPALAAVCGRLDTLQTADGAYADHLVRAAKGSHLRVLPGESWAGFVFAFSVKEFPKVAIEARFDDDKGVSWQVDNDLILTKLPGRDDW